MSIETGTGLLVDTAASANRPWPLWRTWSTRSLLLYGLVVATLATVVLDVAAPRPWPIESARALYLQGALVELDSGGPPLWAKYPTQTTGSQANSAGFSYGPTSPGDDQGAFFYVPGLAHVLGIRDGLTAMRVLYLGLFFLPLLFYPLLFERLFGSTAAGLVAPWALALVLGALGFRDILWITEWAVLALLPPLMLLDRSWPRWGLVWLLSLMVAASFANSIRAQAGLGIALAALIVVFKRPWRWRWRLGALPLLVVAYVSISTFGLQAVRAWRDNSLGHTFHDAGNSHLVWHPLYLGLGYLPNRYGLHWDDSIAVAAVHAHRPNVRYPTAAYDAAVRHLFLRLVEHDPGLFVRSVAAKLLVVLLFSAPALLLLTLIAVVIAATRGRAQTLRRSLVLLAPTLLASLAPPVLGKPELMYQLGWLSALALACILGAAWLAAQLYAPRREDRAWRLRALAGEVRAWIGRSWMHAVAVPACIVVLIAIAVGGYAIRERAARWQAATPAVSNVNAVLLDAR